MLLDEMIVHNKKFVENKDYEQYQTSKLPNKKLVVVSCMDTRLTELLPQAMNLKNGDAKILKTAGAIVSHPFGSILRSIIVAIYELNAHEVCIVGHHDCGMAHVNPAATTQKMIERGISEETIESLDYVGIKIEDWLRGFDSVSESVRQSVEVIRKHPLIPKDIPVHGLVINPDTGALDVIENGYLEQAAK
ncbi:beta-class carbonic anhydrase [Paenibacillus sp. MMS18-CY102]|uniref:beta-class carbonic anhydrase n=1 Tax=Paenibacillus sp. MMS18-CY102 TaxID=2682849 RepID=UPI001365837E|nr:carbonic anhydrase [Paenibacillus sp. MMS18-CY102]MWC30513.1 carbonic anhydrase [Paenibacillus sp. MMS18-CY102]